MAFRLLEDAVFVRQLTDITANELRWKQTNCSTWPPIRVIGVVFSPLILISACVILAARRASPLKKLQECMKAQACFSGFIVALGLHWFPCFWWTCDFDANCDASAIRTLIFLASWMLITPPLVYFSKRDHREEFEYKLDNYTNEEKEAIKQGSLYRPRDELPASILNCEEDHEASIS